MSFMPPLHRWLVSAAVVLWLLACVWTLATTRIEGWGVKVSVQLEHDSNARLYWNSGDGISEEQALSRSVRGGKSRTLYFPLPPDMDLHELRFDPGDRTGAVTVEDFKLVGPLGWWSGQRSEIRLKPGLDLEQWQQDGNVVHAVSTGSDPQIYLRFKPGPQQFPTRARVWARAVSAAIIGILGLLAMRIFGSRVRRTPGLLLLPAASTWLFGLLLYPGPELPVAWFWLAVAAPALIVLLLDPAASLASAKSAASSWYGRFFLLLIGYWIGRAMFLPQGVEPGRGLVLLDLAVIPILALAAAVCFQRSDPALSRFAATLGTGLFVVASWKAVSIILEFYGHQPLSSRLHPSHDELWFPLYRPNSGTAVFCLLLVAWLCANFRFPLSRRRNPANSGQDGANHRRQPLSLASIASTGLPALLYLGGAPILAYGLLSQSRSALLALSAACLLIALAATLRRTKVAAAVALVFTIVLGLGNFGPRLESWRTGRESAVSAAAAPAPVRADADDSERGILRPAVARPTIWKTYLSKSVEKPLLGHGFSGAQTLMVELPVETLDEDIQHLRHTQWNPHNLHLSIFYFGGALGLILHVGTLLLIWWGLLIAGRRGKQMLPLALAAVLTFGCGQLTFESTLMAYGKKAVLLHQPNEFWMLFWIPVCLGVGWLTAKQGCKS